MSKNFNYKNEDGVGININPVMVDTFKKAYKTMGYDKGKMFDALDLYAETFPQLYNGQQPDAFVIEVMKRHIEIATEEVDKERQQ